MDRLKIYRIFFVAVITGLFFLPCLIISAQDGLLVDDFENGLIKNWTGWGVKEKDFNISKDPAEGTASLQITLPLDYTPRIFIYRKFDEPVDISGNTELTLIYKLSSVNLHPTVPFIIRLMDTEGNYSSVWQVKAATLKVNEWTKVNIAIPPKPGWGKLNPEKIDSICFRLEAPPVEISLPTTIHLYLDEIKFLKPDNNAKISSFPATVQILKVETPPTVEESIENKNLWSEEPPETLPVETHDINNDGKYETLIAGKRKPVSFIAPGTPPPKIIVPAGNYLLNIVGEDIKKYIEQITGISPIIVNDAKGLEGNLIVLTPEADITSIEIEGFIIKTDFSDSQNVLTIQGKSDIGVQYGAYHFLELLGVRFFHPQEEFIPKREKILLGELHITENPVYKVRGIHPHRGMTIIPPVGNYPLESNFKRWVENRETQKVKALVDWLSKNKQNFIYGYLQFFPLWVKEYAEKRGVKIYGGIHLFPKDKGQTIKTTDEQLRENYRTQVKNAEKSGFEYVFLETGTPERYLPDAEIKESLERILILCDVIKEEGAPLKCIYSVHGSYEQSPKLKVLREMPLEVTGDVHTLLDRNLFGPCWDMYGLDNYHDFLCTYKQELSRKREMWYFPEATWGVNYDIDVPIYRPYYLYSRWLDSVYLAKKGATGHYVYTQGLEWLYWLNAYGTFRLQWNPYKNHWTDIIKNYSSIYSPAAEDKIREAFEKSMIAWELIDRYGLPMRIGIRGAELYRDLFVSLLGKAGKYADWRKNKLDIFRQATELVKESYELTVSAGKEVPPTASVFYKELLDCMELNYYHFQHHYLAYTTAALLYEYENGINTAPETIKDTYSAMLNSSEKVKQIIARRKKQYINPEDFQIGLEEKDKTALGKQFSSDILDFYGDGYVIEIGDAALYPALKYFLNRDALKTVVVDDFENGVISNNWNVTENTVSSVVAVRDEAKKGKFVMRSRINFSDPLKAESAFITVALPETLDAVKGGVITFRYKFSDNKISSNRRGGRYYGMVLRMRSEQENGRYNDVRMMDGAEIIPNRWYQGIIPVSVGTSGRLYDYRIKEITFRIQDMPDVATEFDFYADDIQVHLL